MPTDLAGALVASWKPRVAGRGLRIALADGEDDRAIIATVRLQQESLVLPYLVGRPAVIQATAAKPGIALPASLRIVDIDASARDPRLRKIIANACPTPESLVDAEKLFHDPLYVTTSMLVLGEVDASVGGATRPTADVVRAGLRIVGLAPTVRTVSSCFLMLLPDGRRLAYADCAVVPEPSADQLADVATATANTYRQLVGATPVIAMLSFSTHRSARHPTVDKVRHATAIIRACHPHLAIDGELQFDAAVVEEIAAPKGTRINRGGPRQCAYLPEP